MQVSRKVTASFIVNKVAESQGWKNFMFFSAPSIKQWGHEAITKYLNADLTDNDLYVEIAETLNEIKQDLEKS